MPHFKEFYDSQFIGVWSLGGQDVVATIQKIEKGEVGGQSGRKKDKKAIIHFAEFDEPMACNVTNAKTIAGLYGPDVREWVGKRVTLYPTTTTFGRDTVECIRIRNAKPRGESSGKQPRREPGEERAQQNRAAGRKPPPEAVAIGEATNRDELLAAIRGAAGWIDAHSDKVWPKIVARCEELGVDEQDADAALQDALDEAAA